MNKRENYKLTIGKRRKNQAREKEVGFMRKVLNGGWVEMALEYSDIL